MKEGVLQQREDTLFNKCCSFLLHDISQNDLGHFMFLSYRTSFWICTLMKCSRNRLRPH